MATVLKIVEQSYSLSSEEEEALIERLKSLDLLNKNIFFNEDSFEKVLQEHFNEKDFATSLKVFEYSELANYLGFSDIEIYSLQRLAPFAKELGDYGCLSFNTDSKFNTIYP